MPAAMDYEIFGEELWVPTAFSAEQLAMHDEHYLTVFARLNPGVTLAQARAEMESLGRWLETNYPKENKDRSLAISSFMEELVNDYRPRLYVLLGAVGFVLLIACANIANLLLARGAARSRETAIRAAIGAGQGHLLRQALTESLVLAAAGGVLGILFGYWGVALLAGFGPEDVPRLDTARVDGVVLAFAAGLTIAVRHRLRAGARAPDVATHAARSAEGRRPDRVPGREPGPAPQRAGGGRSRAGPGAADRRGTADPERDRAQQRGSRIRPQRAPRRPGVAPRGGI